MKKTPLKRYTPLKRMAFKHKPYEDNIPKEVTEKLYQRSCGQCEFKALAIPYHIAVQVTCPFSAQHRHHVIPRGRGGKDELENLLHLCHRHHDWIHSNVAQATQLGFLKVPMTK